ncbi:MAG TPA: ATP-dependent DNA ligase [Drouetiella sp.]
MLPLDKNYEPMEAKLTNEIPRGAGWQYEPKWDGFRCIAFREGETIQLQSKSQKDLGRYFPEIVEALQNLGADKFIIDSELVIPSGDEFSFDELLQRIHPAESRINKLSKETPAVMIVFDMLADTKGDSLVLEPLSSRRARLEEFAHKYLSGNQKVILSPATTDPEVTDDWLSKMGNRLDGIVAKRVDLPYQSGNRKGMNKVKKIRTVDCVVGGFRYGSASDKSLGSLLLGLYDERGLLNHVGFSSSFTAAERIELVKMLEPLIEKPGFTGDAPGGAPSRWSTERSTEWEPLKPGLVAEITYDHFTNGRFRHGCRFIRWRPDKAPEKCTYDQIHGYKKPVYNKKA